MSLKVVDLRPDRALLKSDFDGYKLSLKPVPIIREPLDELRRPARFSTNLDNQYSFLHQELFGHQNLLFSDPWVSNSVYYIDQGRRVQHVQLKDGALAPDSLALLTIPLHRSRIEGDYNYSLVFVTEDLAIISNGIGGLYLVNTGDRSAPTKWTILLEQIIQDDGDNQGFLIRHASLFAGEGVRRRIDVLLLRIAEDPESKADRFYSKLTTIRFTENGDANWTMDPVCRKLMAKSTVPFCILTNGGRGVLVVCQQSIRVIADTERELDPAEAQITASEDSPFTWMQNDDDVIINFPTIPDCSKNDYFVKCSKDHVEVRHLERTLLDADLCFKVDPTLTTWTVENDYLQLIMIKGEAGQTWTKLTESGPEETMDMRGPAQIPETFINVPNLSSPIEDCDREENEFFLEEIQFENHSISHRSSLGANGPLFSKVICDGQCPSLALRHDVDTCLWTFDGGSLEKRKHVGTLNALAYIAASKQQRKFIDCSPDMEYAVICEPERHVFIYKADYASASGLRNRNGNQLKFGQQKLVTLEETGEVIGISVQNQVTFLLTRNYVLCLKVAE